MGYLNFVVDLTNWTGVKAGEHILGAGTCPVGVLVRCSGISMALGDDTSEPCCILTNTPCLLLQFGGVVGFALGPSYPWEIHRKYNQLKSVTFMNILRLRCLIQLNTCVHSPFLQIVEYLLMNLCNLEQL